MAASESSSNVSVPFKITSVTITACGTVASANVKNRQMYAQLFAQARRCHCHLQESRLIPGFTLRITESVAPPPCQLQRMGQPSPASSQASAMTASCCSSVSRLAMRSSVSSFSSSPLRCAMAAAHAVASGHTFPAPQAINQAPHQPCHAINHVLGKAEAQVLGWPPHRFLAFKWQSLCLLMCWRQSKGTPQDHAGLWGRATRARSATNP